VFDGRSGLSVPSARSYSAKLGGCPRATGRFTGPAGNRGPLVVPARNPRCDSARLIYQIAASQRLPGA